MELKRLKEKINKSKNSRLISNLKKKHKELAYSIRQVHGHKKNMKKMFDDYVKSSGYTPPIFKN